MNVDHSFDHLFEQARDALSRGDYQQSITLFRRCLVQLPQDAHSWFLLGACLDRNNQAQEAGKAFRECERLDPEHSQAANAVAAILMQTGDTREAIVAFHRALVLNPDDPQILANLGIAHEKLGEHQQALTHHDAALRSDANHLGALNNRGALLLKLHRPDNALIDHLRFVNCAPRSPLGHYYCAETYLTLFRETEALAACNATLKIDVNYIRAHFLRGVVLSCLHRFDEAECSFEIAKRIDGKIFANLFAQTGMDTKTSNMPNPANIHYLRQFDRLKVCNWAQYDQFVQGLKTMTALWSTSTDYGLPDLALAHPSLALPLEPEEQLTLARAISAGIVSKMNNIETITASRKTICTDKSAKIRIGYVSPDFRNHATTHLTSSMYRLHDREQFVVHAYSLQPDDGSAQRKQIVAGCDVFHDVSGMQVADIDALIRKDEIDILIDLAGYTALSRPEIFLSRPAPINVNYLGYAGSLGSEAVDYFITDRFASPPEQAAFHTEKLVTLSRSCFPYCEQQAIAVPDTREEYGLPRDAFVFCCFNNSWKIEPAVFDVWMRILQRSLHSVLWLYCPAPAVETNLRSEASRRGIDPTRLIFALPLPVEQHIARYQAADLFLDTFLYGGHTTTLDALWAGLPVLTCPGQTYASRISLSHLSTLGVPELAARSVTEYEEIACALAAEPQRLQLLKQKVATLREASSLFKTKELVCDMERAYREIWKRYQAGLEPAHIELD